MIESRAAWSLASKLRHNSCVLLLVVTTAPACGLQGDDVDHGVTAKPGKSAVGEEAARPRVHEAAGPEGAYGPQVVSATPGDESLVEPEVVVKLVFSERMDINATAAAFSLTRNDVLVAGSVVWDTSGSVLAFRPDGPLAAGDYVASVDTSARDVAGAYLVAGFAAGFAVTEVAPVK